MARLARKQRVQYTTQSTRYFRARVLPGQGDGKLINPDSYDPSAMTHSDFLEIADDGLRVYDCVNEDELRRMQEFAVSALSQ